MTILLALATDNFVFLASDTRRTDLLLPHLKLSASKMRVARSTALVMAGKNVDRTKFADRLIAARGQGEPFIAAAQSIAPELFEEKRAMLPHLPEHHRSQVVFSIYADVDEQGCEATVHQLGDPASFAFTLKGVFVNHPEWIPMCLAAANRFIDQGILALDTWAKAMIAFAAKQPKYGVDFPCELALLRPGMDPVLGQEILPDTPQDPAFSVEISLAATEYQPGPIVHLPAVFSVVE